MRSLAASRRAVSSCCVSTGGMTKRAGSSRNSLRHRSHDWATESLVGRVGNWLLTMFSTSRTCTLLSASDDMDMGFVSGASADSCDGSQAPRRLSNGIPLRCVSLYVALSTHLREPVNSEVLINRRIRKTLHPMTLLFN